MKAIQIATAEGHSIYIQVEPGINFETPRGADDAGGAEGIIEPKALVAKLDEVSDTISGTCKSLQAKIMSGLGKSLPNEMSIEFGVTLGGEAGVPFVANGSVEAAFKVTTTWKFNASGATP
jgi:hypothetical protein